jgi:hypothetical protein
MDNTTTTELNFSGTITPNMAVGTISANNINFNFKFGGIYNYVVGGYEFSSDNFTSSSSYVGFQRYNLGIYSRSSTKYK